MGGHKLASQTAGRSAVCFLSLLVNVILEDAGAIVTLASRAPPVKAGQLSAWHESLVHCDQRWRIADHHGHIFIYSNLSPFPISSTLFGVARVTHAWPAPGLVDSLDLDALT